MGVIGDDVSGKLVGSTEGSRMKVSVVDTGIGVVVTGASGNVGGMEDGMTSRLDGSIVMRDTATGPQQQQQQLNKMCLIMLCVGISTQHRMTCMARTILDCTFNLVLAHRTTMKHWIITTLLSLLLTCSL